MKQNDLKLRYRRLLLPLLLLCLFLAPAPRSSAAAKPVQISSCKLASASKVKVTAKLSNTASVPGSKCYLFALPFGKTTISSGAKPIQSKKKAKTMTFTFALNKTKASSHLYSNFVIAAKKSGKYIAVSDTRYLSNPGKSAKYTYKFPTASSKKGLQVNADMLEDAVELNVRHSVVNFVFNEMFAAKSERNTKTSYAYKYQGKTYWFRKYVIQSYDKQLKALKESNTIVSAILLLGWRDDLTNLIYPSGREKGHFSYAWNTSNASARRQLQAALSFLSERYASSSAKNGRIVNWIVGNEVNNYTTYNYAGSKTLQQHAQIYANAFRMTYNTVTSVYSNARVYISLDHLWNTNTVPGSFASRKMLDAFAAAISRQGRIQWNLAYHPYSSPLTEPKFWENKNQQVTQSLTTPVINMGNISLLTSYIRSTYGASTRIILSEQGFTSVQDFTKNVEKEQSAAIVYSYYLTEADDMIDSFIMNRHIDHKTETAQGLNLGLWTSTSATTTEWADTKKDSWTVFKYMDTNQSPSVSDAYLSQIGAASWSQLVPGYSAALYSKTNIVTVPMSAVASYKKSAAIASNWLKYGAVTTQKKSGKGLRVIHDYRRNRNSLWGFSQSFSKKLSFGTNSRFCTTLKVSGSTGSKVAVKLRFYSGKNILESTGIIPANKQVKLSVSLKDWKYRKAVTKIQVLLAPASGSWKKTAYLDMANTVRAR
ncbi:MAG: DUF5722 domain-containing protein [Eubacteriales bacterium]|nr:DUF5722 domain-containing protein [Eubacteriales bacterium]